MARSRRPIFALVLDQTIVAGCGLIYANEVLFRAGLAPTTPGHDISERCWTALWDDLRALMKEGVARGRIDTVHTAHTPEAMGRAPRMDRHGGEVYVYRRPGQPCLICGTPVARGPMAGRTCTGVRCASHLDSHRVLRADRRSRRRKPAQSLIAACTASVAFRAAMSTGSHTGENGGA